MGGNGADVAVVTGGAQGIGYGIADELAARGAPVVIADIDIDAAGAAADQIADAHGRSTLAVDCDVTAPEEVEALVETAATDLGPVGTFVNNAGGATGMARTWEMSPTEFEDTVAVCLKGTFLGTKFAVSHMLEHETPGSVVNVSSLNHEAATDGMAHYAAAKAGVSQFTEVVAAEAGRHGIRVNAVAPGSTRTPTTEAAMFFEDEMGHEFRERTPLGRFGQPEDIARVVAFLASEDARWVTGATIPVDGGQHIRGLHSYYDTMLEQFGEL